jgi:HK97 family phage major capsid protein
MNVVEGGQVGTMMGYPVFATTKISADNYLLGDFSHLAVGEFGGIEVAMNPFFDDRRFIQSLNAIFTFDAVAIHPTAFCLMTKA